MRSICSVLAVTQMGLSGMRQLLCTPVLCQKKVDSVAGRRRRTDSCAHCFLYNSRDKCARMYALASTADGLSSARGEALVVRQVCLFCFQVQSKGSSLACVRASSSTAFFLLESSPVLTVSSAHIQMRGLLWL